MRCERCGYSSPENHKFCGMCGAKLSAAVSSVAIDDNDPLEIEPTAREPLQFRELDRRREAARDAARSSNGDRRTNVSSATIENFPPDTVQEEAAEEVHHRKPSTRSPGIGGPSFLGLGYEDSNSGFIYDKPKDDAFVYDTESETPEYLLTEVSRGVSWRAWAFFLLLIVGGGLGYIQWRASHNQGPDIAAILSGNGATVDPSGPDMTKKPASLRPPAAPPDSSSTSAAKSGTDQDASPETESSTPSVESENSAASKESAEAKNATVTEKTAKTDKTAKADEDAADGNSSSKSAKATAKSSDEDSDESAKPESDGPVAKVTKAKKIPPIPVEEEAPQPKSLGEKDPLIVQANKQLRAKNCSSAVNLLRQASSAGNPSADVKMGALYWSGTCVTQSNVTAYQWFARAHALEPNNRWIERSRTSLWAKLSPSERRRVGY
jgi:hypothetical protein